MKTHITSVKIIQILFIINNSMFWSKRPSSDVDSDQSLSLKFTELERLARIKF